MDLERKRDTILKTNATKDKYNLFRNLCKRYEDHKYSAFMQWVEAVRYYNHVKQRIKLRIINTHKKRCSAAFFKWKEGIDKKHMVQLVEFTEEL